MCPSTLDFIVVLGVIVTICAAWSDKDLELPAFEFRRQFNYNLSPGECPNRIVQYPESLPFPEHCTFPRRTGQEEIRWKPLSHVQRTSIKTSADLLRLMPLCNQEAANYFGLLAKGDCVTSEIAQKLSFGRKKAVLVHLEHDRPRISELVASTKMDIPEEYSLYLNNSYYTHKIDIGTDELIIAELWYKKDKDATMASKDFTDKSLSEHLMRMMQNPSIALPRKIKMIRLSTAENVFETKIFKGAYSIFEAMDYASSSERNITRVKNQILHGKDAHLKYTFTPYEIGPIALPYNSVSDRDRKQLWEDVALLQVELKRIYTANKRFRKFCRKTKDYRKFCLLAKQTLKELKKTVTEVHTQRRDWAKLITFNAKLSYVEKCREKLRSLDDRMRIVARFLRKAMKKKSSA